MIKRKEVNDPKSCLNRARDDEMVFVLLGRDRAAATAIRAWARERVWLGLNSHGDAQITESLDLADAIQNEQQQRKEPG